MSAPATCPAWCSRPADHDPEWHVGPTIDSWTGALGDLAVRVEEFIKDGVNQPPVVVIEGRLDRGSQEMAELEVADARRMATAVLAACDAAER